MSDGCGKTFGTPHPDYCVRKAGHSGDHAVFERRAELLDLRDEVEELRKDKARLDWFGRKLLGISLEADGADEIRLRLDAAMGVEDADR